MPLQKDFNYIIFVDETRVPGENHRPVTGHWQTWSHNAVSITPRLEKDSNSQINKDCLFIFVNWIIFYVTLTLHFNHLDAWAKVINVNRKNKTTIKSKQKQQRLPQLGVFFKDKITQDYSLFKIQYRRGSLT